MIGKHAAQKLVGPANSATDGGDQPQRRAKLFGRQNIAEDQVCNLKDRSACALQETPRAEDRNIRRKHRHDGSDAHGDERVDQNFSSSGMVAVSGQNDAGNSANQKEESL